MPRDDNFWFEDIHKGFGSLVFEDGVVKDEGQIKNGGDATQSEAFFDQLLAASSRCQKSGWYFDYHPVWFP